jgi:hypothetical protein
MEELLLRSETEASADPQKAKKAGKDAGVFLSRAVFTIHIQIL